MMLISLLWQAIAQELMNFSVQKRRPAFFLKLFELKDKSRQR
jgi:hypothetical protein